VNPLDTVSRVRTLICASGLDYHEISYLYVVNPGEKSLLGVVDARQMLVESDSATMEQIMASPVVAAESDDIREDIATLFGKYHFRMVPVVDTEDQILGVIKYGDIMTSTGPRS
jgi:magnesium transporter